MSELVCSFSIRAPVRSARSFFKEDVEKLDADKDGNLAVEEYPSRDVNEKYQEFVVFLHQTMKPRTKIEIRLCGENGVDQKITINLKELYRLSYLAKLAEMPLENFLQLITCDEQGYVTGINLSKPTEANKDRIITSEYFQRLKYVREGKAERKILEAKRESFFSILRQIKSMKDGDVVLWEYGSFVKTGGRQFEELVRERENFYRLNGDYFEYYEKGMRKGERAMRISHHENLLERIDAALGQFDLQGIK